MSVIGLGTDVDELAQLAGVDLERSQERAITGEHTTKAVLLFDVDE